MKVLILSSFAFSLVNFRGRLIETMLQLGHEVIACAPDDDPEVREWLEQRGARYCRIDMARAGMNPFADMKLLWSYGQAIRTEQPDVVLAYTQKPIIYGGLAARMFGRARFYALVTGLGYVFSPAAKKRRLLRAVVSLLYRFAIAPAHAIFVFNSEDAGVLEAHGIVSPGTLVTQVAGSGVDLTYFQAEPLPKGPLVFLMIARLMRDKGVLEYAEAARRIRSEYPDVTFRLLGRLDDNNPTGIGEGELSRWVEDGVLEYHSETRDVRPLLAASSVFVLPSYYREGLPRTLLEAMATGRALITSDLPGCREAVRPGLNGLLVPPQDVSALVKAMRTFLADPDLVTAFGAQSRRFAAERFDVELVNRDVLAMMDLGSAVPSETSSRQVPAWSAAL